MLLNLRARLLGPTSSGERAINAPRSRTDDRRATEVDVAVRALNRMTELGRPNYVRTA